jgi:hypothetical protein
MKLSKPIKPTKPFNQLKYLLIEITDPERVSEWSSFAVGKDHHNRKHEEDIFSFHSGYFSECSHVVCTTYQSAG